MLAAGTAFGPTIRASAPRRRLGIVQRDDPRRADVERFIAGVYRRHYGARVAHWAPTLVTLSLDGRLVAGAGYRRADESLFLERYLERPIEAAIAAHAGRRIDRGQVCEVGHFASMQPGAGRRLLLLLARHLADVGFAWVASTATRELRAMLSHVGLHPFALAPADPMRLGASAQDWGRYYEHDPVVVAGDLARGLTALETQRKR